MWLCRRFVRGVWSGGGGGGGAMERPVPYKTGAEAEQDGMAGWINYYEELYEAQVGEHQLLEKMEVQYEVGLQLS
jgi:hypothetical protein